MILITIDLLDIAFLAWWRIEQAILQRVQIGVGDALSAIVGGQSTDDVVPLRAKLHFTIATACAVEMDAVIQGREGPAQSQADKDDQAQRTKDGQEESEKWQQWAKLVEQNGCGLKQPDCYAERETGQHDSERKLVFHAHPPIKYRRGIVHMYEYTHIKPTCIDDALSIIVHYH